MKKWIVIILIVIVAAYGGVSYYFSNQLLYPPLMSDEEIRAEYGPILPEEVDLLADRITFPPRGEKPDGDMAISALWIEAKDTGSRKRVFVLVHGRNSNKKALIRFASIFIDKGISTLLIDLRGHGDSTKAFATFGDKEREDVMGAVDYLLKKGYTVNDNIGLFGISMGATSSFLAAMDLNREKAGTVDILVFDSGIADVPATIELNSRKAVGDAVPFLLPGALLMTRLRSGADFKDGNPISHVDDIDIPILFIMHGKDELVPYDDQVKLFERYKGPKEELTFEELGHHRGHAEKGAEYESSIYKFLRKYDF